MGTSLPKHIARIPRVFFNNPQDLNPDDPDSDCVQDIRDLIHSMSLFDAWRTSRPLSSTPAHDGHCSELTAQPGSPRKLSLTNILLAARILRVTFWDMFFLLWGLNPFRTAVLVLLTIIRGIFPVFRGYSHALILDELQNLISSGDFHSSRLVNLVVREGFRMLAESLFDTFANHNENTVYGTVRFYMERSQLQQRLRLDLPTLADPVIRDLLHESDLFVRSFTGLGFGFGLFSPFDLVRLLSSFAELAGQFFVLYSASRGTSLSALFSFSDASDNTSDVPSQRHLPLLGVLLLPSLLSLIASCLPPFPFSASSSGSDTPYTPGEARAAEEAERMRSLAHGESFRPEVVLFGLAPWIIGTWATARRRILGLEVTQSESGDAIFSFGSCLRWLLTQTNLSEMFVLLQNLPFFIYTNSTSLGSLALYRSSIQSLLYNFRTIATSCERAYQSIFFMGAFFAANSVKPHLSPPPEKSIKYESIGRGMKIEARNIFYTYPGSLKPTLRNVNFTLEAGETLAIVGYNGSGKSTLANILLRIFDFDDTPKSQLMINGVDIRSLSPSDYHLHVTALFQSFSKLNATVRENVGIGDVQAAFQDRAVREAAARAGAVGWVNGLPRGLDTDLECMTMGMTPFGEGLLRDEKRKGLSGGEWQRVAISRAFMRARTADLLLFDEPTSHLDAHAQNKMLETIDSICRDPRTGKKVKTVIIITHQLSIARRADKVAMFKDGTITEFGTHDQLLANPSSHYAELYSKMP